MKKKKYAYLANAEFIEETGESIATIHTDLGVFEGRAQCSPEDFERQSRLFGCRIAETRAWIKYFRLKCSKLAANVALLKDMNKEYKYAFLENKLQEQSKALAQYQYLINKYRETIIEAINEREKWNKLVKRRQEKIKNFQINKEENQTSES